MHAGDDLSFVGASPFTVGIPTQVLCKILHPRGGAGSVVRGT